MRDKNGKITVKSFWHWLRSDKGKKYSFVIFYFFFFLFLFLLLTFQGTDTLTNKEESVFPYSIKNIEEGDYSFSYLVLVNDSFKEFVGNKKGRSITIQDDTGSYSYLYQNGNLLYQGIEEPLQYPEFLNIYNIKMAIKEATLQAETKLTATKQYIYTYTIKNSSFSKILNKEITSTEENEIIIKTNTMKEVEEIQLNLLNVMKELSEEEIKNYTITFTYGEKYE